MSTTVELGSVCAATRAWLGAVTASNVGQRSAVKHHLDRRAARRRPDPGRDRPGLELADQVGEGPAQAGVALPAAMGVEAPLSEGLARSTSWLRRTLAHAQPLRLAGEIGGG